ncbi:serine hydrolase domain-containing protein [Streptomyces platensis]|uniref:serine hydrolase domain-containing protein n=1 Tax=Streptomyces platensis TaxID=58346 RepID=UPI00386F745C|nr:serine hydrolase [Streptomyces platensis]
MAVDGVPQGLPPRERLVHLAGSVVELYVAHPYVGAAVACRTLIAAGTALAVLMGGSYAATSIMNIPSPPDLVRLQTTPPSGWGEPFPARSIAKAGHTTALPTSLRQHRSTCRGRAARMMLTRDLRTFVKDHRDLTCTPGSQASYRSVDTMMLGPILIRVEKKPLADLLSEGIWKPVGATHTATWNLDREDGVEKAFCGLNATARDFAKIGQLVLDKGSANGQQIIPEKWVTRLATPAPHRIDNWGYSAQWWHPSGGNRRTSRPSASTASTST